MTEEIDFDTFLSIEKDRFQIFLFDKKNLKNLYKNEFIIKNDDKFRNLNNLSNFLDENIFKIEKLTGKFIKNIFLIIDSSENLNVNISVKKKNYDNLINEKNLKNILIEVKDLFKENYQEHNIMHMVIKSYLINGKKYSSLINNLNTDHLCLEINFVSIPNELFFIFNKTLEKYQVKITQYISRNYIKNLFKDDHIEISEMAHRILNGYNSNEVILVPKNIENKGFFERFFQLFS